MCVCVCVHMACVCVWLSQRSTLCVILKMYPPCFFLFSNSYLICVCVCLYVCVCYKVPSFWIESAMGITCSVGNYLSSSPWCQTLFVPTLPFGVIFCVHWTTALAGHTNVNSLTLTDIHRPLSWWKYQLLFTFKVLCIQSLFLPESCTQNHLFSPHGHCSVMLILLTYQGNTFSALLHDG